MRWTWNASLSTASNQAVAIPARWRPVQARDAGRAVAQGMTVDRLRAALRVDQPAPAWTDEAGRDRKARLVQGRHDADEHVPSVTQGCEPSDQGHPGQLRADGVIQHRKHVAGDQVTQASCACVSAGLNAQQPELSLSQRLERRRLGRTQAGALPGQPVKGGLAAGRRREQSLNPVQFGTACLGCLVERQPVTNWLSSPD